MPFPFEFYGGMMSAMLVSSNGYILLGDLGSEQVVDVVLRITFPYGTLGHEVGTILAIRDGGRTVGAGVVAKIIE